MSLNIYFLAIYLLCFLWASIMYFFFLGPLIRSLFLFKRNNITCKLDLISGRLIIKTKDNNVYFFTITNKFFFYRVTISSPIKSNSILFIQDKDNKENEFFFFAKKNYFIHSASIKNSADIYINKNKFQYIFSHYEAIFENNPLKEVLIDINKTSLITNSKRPSLIVSNFYEITNMIKDVNYTVNKDLKFEKSKEFEKKITEKLFLSIATTILFILFIWFIPKTNNSSNNAYIPDYKIQLWEVYGDYANVFDLQKQADNIQTLATNVVKLSVYKGEKPEVVPWGFKIKPDPHYRLSYKLILLPKETEIVGYTNINPIVEKIYGDYLFLFYDVSEIKTETSIKIYMKYHGNMVPLNKHKLREYFSQWYFLS